MKEPAARIHLIEESLRCFMLGWLSLIPVLGLAPGVLAIRLHFLVWAGEDGGWNPAKRYLLAGLCLAWCGIAISIAALAVGLLILVRYEG